MVSAKPDIESRLAKIESMLQELLGILAGQEKPGRYEYERALREFARGNRAPLERYIKKGGKPHGKAD